ncbi:two-component system histidine kinase PnpS [Sporosarcina sp. HYO08]|uniref:two-component system histidine kinase PnpS n=1 Tax=Sporosarcina sp. HYO08 TaxID=1759557 RepID=UPI00079525A0|nr:ATP-binding protein [Sporosarcina sp. HYO08]KXH87202.1 PAS domain-containing sensor histidine kinase [Sporosarcina sp. HYO08]
MKGFYSRLVMACAILFSILLTGLGIVLGQFFPLFADDIELTVRVKYWIFLITILIIAFLLSMIIAAKMMRQYAKPVDEITKKAIQIAKGDYFTRIQTEDPEYDSELANAINTIAVSLQEMSTHQTTEQERLKTLIESMGSGLLTFGRQGFVNLANGVFEKTFGFSKDELVGKTVKEIGLPADIAHLIEEVFMTEKVHEKQVRIQSDSGYSIYMNVYGAPVIGIHGNWLGIIVVMHDITKLIRLEEVRKDFVANVSHELRTPVTSIKGFSETLLDGAMDDPEILKEFLQIIQKESERLHVLIKDLLVLSGAEREGFSLQIAPVHIKPMIDEALKIVLGKLKRKEMKAVVHGSDDIVIQGDESRLMQVMVNLLTNAISYSRELTTITITIEQVDTSVLISIKDQGIGIKQSELPRLFERFYRVDRARSRDSGGTGLGLAIVKHLVEAHHGTVEVESTIGVGSEFRIQLPLQQPH